MKIDFKEWLEDRVELRKLNYFFRCKIKRQLLVSGLRKKIPKRRRRNNFNTPVDEDRCFGLTKYGKRCLHKRKKYSYSCGNKHQSYLPFYFEKGKFKAK